MSKQFTLADVQEITKICHVTGVQQFWCNILLTGGSSEPHEFLASVMSESAFSKEVFDAIQAGSYGEPSHGTAEWYRTQPAEQPELETKYRAVRDDLLLKSDYIDSNVTQARLSAEQKTAWETYRQALRNITHQPTFPFNIVWPTKP
jgi:hypothetical protein